MNYVIIVVIVYIMLRYIEPILDGMVVWVQTVIQVNLQYKSLNLQSYSESFDVKESVVGYITDDSGGELICPQDCEGCPYTEECGDFGEFLKAKKSVGVLNSKTQIGKVENTPTCKITRVGFIQN